jgi:hypothetical protein
MRHCARYINIDETDRGVLIWFAFRGAGADVCPGAGEVLCLFSRQAGLPRRDMRANTGRSAQIILLSCRITKILHFFIITIYNLILEKSFLCDNSIPDGEGVPFLLCQAGDEKKENEFNEISPASDQ